MNWLNDFITLGESVLVTDPGYAEKNWCNESVERVLPGRYRVSVKLNNEGRVKELRVTHEDYLQPKSHSRHEHISNCAVDSGTLGVFDEIYFMKDAPLPGWYDDHVLSWCGQSKHHVSDGKGVVSESGYGDGYYPLYTAVNGNNKVVSFKIIFI